MIVQGQSLVGFVVGLVHLPRMGLQGLLLALQALEQAQVLQE